MGEALLWLEKNIEWCFSGIGVAALLFVFRSIFSKVNSSGYSHQCKKTKQVQKAGKYSNNYIANGNIIVNSKTSSDDVRSNVIDAFKESVIIFRGQAGKESIRRAKEFVDIFLKEMQEIYPQGVNSFNDPDMQAILLDALRIYSRVGKNDEMKILINLLIERSKEVSDTKIDKKIINKSIKVISDLAIDQINTITSIFLLRYVALESDSIDDFKSRVCKIYSKYINLSSYGNGTLSYLDSCGVAGTRLGPRSNFYDNVIDRYGSFFSRGFSLSKLEELNVKKEFQCISTRCFRDSSKLQFVVKGRSELLSVMKSNNVDTKLYPVALDLFNLGIMSRSEIAFDLSCTNHGFEEFMSLISDKNLLLHSTYLTSVGKCIALSNLEANGVTLDYREWISD